MQNTVTQIVTSDDVSRWVDAAVMEELFAAGYDVRTVASVPQGVLKGLRLRLERLSSNQRSDGLILLTDTEIGLAVDIWKNGRLTKTLTATAGRQDQGIDRSGAVVSESVRATLQSVLGQLMPSIVESLKS